MEKNSNQIQEMNKCFQYFKSLNEEELRRENDFFKKMKKDKYDFFMSVLKLEPEDSDFEIFCEDYDEWEKNQKIRDDRFLRVEDHERNLLYLLFLFQKNKDLFFILKNHKDLMEKINSCI